MSGKREIYKGKRTDGSTTYDMDSLTVSGYAVLTTNSNIVTAPVTSTKGTYVVGDNATFDSSGGKFSTGCFTGTRGVTGSYVLVKGLSQSDFSGSWTVEFWFKSTATSQTTTVFSMFGQGHMEFQLGGTTQLFPGWYLRNTSSTIVTQPVGTGTAHNTWYHTAVSYSSSAQAYYVGYNGTVYTTTSTQTIQSDNIANYGFCLGARYNSSGYEIPDFQNSAACQISDLRISSTARYTSAYTVPTTSFSSDSTTILINSLAGSGLASYELSPTTTSGYNVVLNTSGCNVITAVSATRGNLTTTAGSVRTENGAVVAYRDFRSINSGWRQGCETLFTSSSIGTTSGYGCYTVCSNGWTPTATSHVIPPSALIMNSSNTNVQGILTVYFSDKVSTGTGKSAVSQCHYLYTYGNTAATVLTVATSKSSNITTFSIANTASSAGVTVTTDSGRIAWRFDASI